MRSAATSGVRPGSRHDCPRVVLRLEQARHDGVLPYAQVGRGGFDRQPGAEPRRRREPFAGFGVVVEEPAVSFRPYPVAGLGEALGGRAGASFHPGDLGVVVAEFAAGLTDGPAARLPGLLDLSPEVPHRIGATIGDTAGYTAGCHCCHLAPSSCRKSRDDYLTP